MHPLTQPVGIGVLGESELPVQEPGHRNGDRKSNDLGNNSIDTVAGGCRDNGSIDHEPRKNNKLK